jgi:hypothetical protein
MRSSILLFVFVDAFGCEVDVVSEAVAVCDEACEGGVSVAGFEGYDGASAEFSAFGDGVL